MKFAFVTDVHRCRSRSTTAPKIIWTLHSHKTNWISYQRTLILRKRSISTFCSSKKKVLKTKNIVSLNLYLFSPLVEIRHTPSFQSFLYPVSPNIIIRASGEALLSVPAKQNRQQAAGGSEREREHITSTSAFRGRVWVSWKPHHFHVLLSASETDRVSNILRPQAFSNAQRDVLLLFLAFYFDSYQNNSKADWALPQTLCDWDIWELAAEFTTNVTCNIKAVTNRIVCDD